MADRENILDYFPEDHEQAKGFNNDDVIVVARVFLDPVVAQIASSKLRIANIAHFLSDSNSNFTENIMDGYRLFIREEDMELVRTELEGIKQDHYEGEEEWYKEVRTNQGYQPFQILTFMFFAAIVLGTLCLVVFFLLGEQ